MGIVACGLLSFGATGCIASNPPRNIPLYEQPQSTIAPERVVRLNGYVQLVDGRDVSSKGDSFELLPGCHVVVTPEKWGHTEYNAGAMVVWITGHVRYAIPMHAGRSYSIRVDADPQNSTGVTGVTTAREFDAEGRLLRTFKSEPGAFDRGACH